MGTIKPSSIASGGVVARGVSTSAGELRFIPAGEVMPIDPINVIQVEDSPLIMVPTAESQRQWSAIDRRRLQRLDSLRAEVEASSISESEPNDERVAFDDYLADPTGALKVFVEDSLHVDGEMTTGPRSKLVTLHYDEYLAGALRRPADEIANHHRRAAQRERLANALLDVWAAILPARLVNEEIGDYLEDVSRRVAEGQCWRVWLRVITAIGWTGLNAFGYVLKALGKKQAG